MPVNAFHAPQLPALTHLAAFTCLRAEKKPPLVKGSGTAPPANKTASKKDTMKKNCRASTPEPAGKRHSPKIQRRINAGWLKLWRAVYPNTPPPRQVQSPGSRVQGPAKRCPAAVERLAAFLAVWSAFALLVTGCAGSRPLKGGRVVTSRNPAGVIKQTLVQSENPAAASKQDQESVKVRTYTVPAGSRIEQSQPPDVVAARSAAPISASREPSTLRSVATGDGSTISSQPSTTSYQPSTSFVLSSPMPVVEREETHAAAELGAAQKDTARELGAKLSSLKGIVWVGVGLFVFGLASLVWPPLKLVIGSVTTSAALMLGGLALMVLPSLIVGNELLILGAVTLAVGGWFLAHRHGQLRGIVAASTPSPVTKAVSSNQ
jgi:hypothetical protein